MNELPAGLTDVELRALSAGAQVDLLVALEQQRRRYEAAQLRLLAVMQARDDSELNLVQEEVSLALQVPLRTAQLRLAQASTLVAELPRTLAAVADGSLSAAHANVLAEAVWRLPADKPELPAALEQRVLPRVLAAGTVTVRQLRGRVRRAVLALDPAIAEQRHQRALASGVSSTGRRRMAWPACTRCCPPRKPSCSTPGSPLSPSCCPLRIRGP